MRFLGPGIKVWVVVPVFRAVVRCLHPGRFYRGAPTACIGKTGILLRWAIDQLSPV